MFDAINYTTVESAETTALRYALALIEDEEHWCVAARFDPIGRMCAVGALEVATGRMDGYWHKFRDLCGSQHLRRAAKEMGGTVMQINDCRGHAATLAMFDRAIELSKAA